MGARGAAAAGLLCLLWHLVSSNHIQPSCHTDYATELICRWEVDAITNCTTEFKLLYQASDPRGSKECALKNEQGPGTASHCICIIPAQKFRLVTFNVVLARRRNGAVVWNVTQEMGSIVKPRPLINLTVEKRENDTFILTWKRDYEKRNELYQAVANYQVAYWVKNETGTVIILPEVSSHHKIFANKLRSRSTYEASVRYGLTLWGGTWSEWSATCEWFNDFEASSEKGPWTFIPWLCVMIIALILSCYLCFLWLKRKWWDRIPSPAKSKMVEDMTARELFSVFGKMETAAQCKRVPCDSRKRPFHSKDGFPHQPTSVNWEPFLIPEVSLIEGALTTCSIAAGVKLRSPEEEEEEEEVDHIPHEDAVAGLFRDLLCGVLSTGDPGPPTTPAQSSAAPEKSDFLKGLTQPAYRGCSVMPEGSGLALRLGQGPSSPEVRANWPSGLQSLPAAPSGTVIPGRVSPRAEERSESSAAAPSAPGYKSFSSLEAQAGSSFSQAWKQWPSLPQGGQPRAQGSPGPGLLPPGTDPPLDTSGRCPAGPDLLSLYGAAADMWLLPPQQGVTVEASALQGPGPVWSKDRSLSGPKASLFSGYRSFSCALQNSISAQEFCLGLESPYKAFLSSVPSDPGLEAAQALGSPAWPNTPWGWVGTDH